MNQFIVIIFSSTVIATSISAIFTYLQNRKNSNLQYITLERKAWRDELRSISEEIWNADIENIDSVMVKLKVRVNAYGNFNKSIFQDAHIWRIIKYLELNTAEKTDEDFAECKRLLLQSISLLLKFDWDRTKREVKGNILNIVEKISLFFFMSVFELMSFYRYGVNKPVSVVVSIFVILLIVKMYRKMSEIVEGVYTEQIKEKYNDIEKQNKFLIIVLGFIAINLYVYDKSLEVSISAVLSTFVGISNYLIIIISPYLLWYTSWLEIVSSRLE